MRIFVLSHSFFRVIFLKLTKWKFSIEIVCVAFEHFWNDYAQMPQVSPFSTFDKSQIHILYWTFMPCISTETLDYFASFVAHRFVCCFGHNQCTISCPSCDQPSIEHLPYIWQLGTSVNPLENHWHSILISIEIRCARKQPRCVTIYIYCAEICAKDAIWQSTRLYHNIARLTSFTSYCMYKF